MTSEKLIQVFRFYDAELEKRGIRNRQTSEYDSTGVELKESTPLEHARWMCPVAIEHVQDGNKEKAFRWLGFIQGVLWMSNIYTLNDLKNHSRPDPH